MNTSDIAININPPAPEVSTVSINHPGAVDVTFGLNGKARTVRMILSPYGGLDRHNKSVQRAALAVLTGTALTDPNGERGIACRELGIDARAVYSELLQ